VLPRGGSAGGSITTRNRALRRETHKPENGSTKAKTERPIPLRQSGLHKRLQLRPSPQFLPTPGRGSAGSPDSPLASGVAGNGAGSVGLSWRVTLAPAGA
jgi:hypothetical protein